MSNFSSPMRILKDSHTEKTDKLLLTDNEDEVWSETETETKYIELCKAQSCSLHNKKRVIIKAIRQRD